MAVFPTRSLDHATFILLLQVFLVPLYLQPLILSYRLRQRQTTTTLLLILLSLTDLITTLLRVPQSLWNVEKAGEVSDSPRCVLLIQQVGSAPPQSYFSEYMLYV